MTNGMLARLGTGLLAVVIMPPFLRADTPSPRPNIVLCMADDQGYGDVGYYGNPLPHTPHLDAMAAASLRLDRFYAAAPVCSPTRGSVLTGRHPNRFGCFRWGYTLRPDEVTLGEVFQKAGYTTGHFGKWHLGSVRKSSVCSPANNGFDKWLSSPNFYENDPWMSDNGKSVRVLGESSEIAMMAALSFIREAADQKTPFLAVVWFGSPHSPHIADPIDRKHYADEPEKVQNYYGEITGIDRAMGTLRAALRVMGLAENTIVWYTSDNGAQTSGNRPGSNGPLAGRKGTLWEGGIRVPTIIEWPAVVSTPRTSNTLSGTVDILPTLIELAGITQANPSPILDGISLKKLIHGEQMPSGRQMGFWDVQVAGRPVRSTALLTQLAEEQAAGQERPASELYPREGTIELELTPKSSTGSAAWMDGPYKLLRLPGKNGPPEFKLFHLGEDPGEKNDLGESDPKRVQRMKKNLTLWQESVIRSFRGEDYPP